MNLTPASAVKENEITARVAQIETALNDAIEALKCHTKNTFYVAVFPPHVSDAQYASMSRTLFVYPELLEMTRIELENAGYVIGEAEDYLPSQGFSVSCY